jgi:hypothetical protein
MRFEDIWPDPEFDVKKPDYKDGVEEGLSNKEPLREQYERLGDAQDATVWLPHNGGKKS